MPSKNVKIDVNVEVEKFYNGGSVDECCRISDDNGGSSPNGKPEQFESNVYAAKKVTWQPVKKGENANEYDLDLSQIDFESGVNIFNKNPLYAGSNGKIQEKVRNNVSVGDEEKYDISFNVTKKGGSEKPGTIDPKLKIIHGGGG